MSLQPESSAQATSSEPANPSRPTAPSTATGPSASTVVHDGHGAVQPPGQPPSPQSRPGQASGGQALNPTLFEQIVARDDEHYTSLRTRVTQAYETHTVQYWFVASLANGLLFLQILVAASLTVLGAFKDHRARTASIFLGATNTVVAGLLTYFKSRNQPNRARQFRDALQDCVQQLDDAEANFRNPNWTGNVFDEMEKVRSSYNRARKDARANYPDLWVRAGSLYDPMHAPRGGTTDSTGSSVNGQQPDQRPHANTMQPNHGRLGNHSPVVG
ncbi:uncharacterized protein PV06_02435 [Exophiala oligosperma]|uniref:SMODS and SLOG-associating 2TM effector domain-containing protein n=1 Tax=Exophiala oligosperma TaxID=215243 RepID=A0A0D2EFT5_9EURO|nr:uncharacterized protein PV06_02435 [Exophiala oligosperma]KIW46799.1 hypothetical protein PV06_02435 [Exophiala oligosperma]